MRKLSIKHNLYLLAVILLLPMVLFQSLRIYELYNYSIESQLKVNNDFAEAVNASFMNYIDKIWDTELSIGLAINNNKVYSSNDMNIYMSSILKQQSSVLDYAWVDSKTLSVIGSSNRRYIGKSIKNNKYVNRILKGEEKIVSDIITFPETGISSFAVARAIRQNGEIKGIVIAIVDIESICSAFPKNTASQSDTFGIIDKNSIIVYSSSVANIAKDKVSLNGYDSVKRALKNSETVKTKKTTSEVSKKEIMSVDVPIKQIEWAAYAYTPYDEVWAYVMSNIKNAMICFVVTIIISLLLVFKLLKQILSPINILKEAAVKISNGDFSMRTNISGNDEVATAAKAFDKMAEYVQESDKLKMEFVSNISHELKTPLNIILSSVQLVSSNLANELNASNQEKNTKYFKIMKQNCYRLLRLINNLIDISKIDSGFMKFNFSDYNIVAIVEDITISVAQFAESKGIEVIFDTDIEEKAVLCDPDKIERILLNLLSNSIKFTPKGGHIYVNIYNNSDTVIINVRDTGIGIAEDKLKIIFDRFRQVDSSLHREYEGSGIGLSLVKSIVEAHHGSINVSSILGQGSSFSIELLTSNVSLTDQSNKNKSNQCTFDKVQRINIEFSDIYS